MMAACGRRDFDVSLPIIKVLLERTQGANVAYKAPPSFPRHLCSRLGLSRDTPIKNAASQPELLRLLLGAGATLDAHIVVYAVEDWCDEIAGHLGEVWEKDLANNEDLRGLYHFSQFPCATDFCPDSFTKADCSPDPPVTPGLPGIIDLVDSDSDTESDTKNDSACSPPFIKKHSNRSGHMSLVERAGLPKRSQTFSVATATTKTARPRAMRRRRTML